MGWVSGLLALGLLVPAAEDGLEEAVAEFQKSCFECHGADAAKGGLRLHEAGGWADQVDPDDVESSELLYRLHLEADDPDAMPPEGPRLSKESIAAVTAWIEAGASEDALAEAIAAAAAAAARRAATAVEISARTGARVDVLRVDGEFAGYSVSWSHRPEPPTRARFEALVPIGPDVLELSLAGTEFQEDWLVALPDLPKLIKLDLARTRVGDKGLREVTWESKQLRRANLSSTAVTAGGIALLRKRCGSRVRVDAFDTQASRRPSDPFASVASLHPRRILAGDASKKRVALLREIAIGKPELLWERPVEQMHDLQWLGESPSGGGHGRVLVQETWTRLVEVDTATNEILWSYDAKPGEGEAVEIHSFRRLGDGTTMVAESGRGRVAFVDAFGVVVGSFELTLDAPHAHHDTRLVRPTPTGTFLVAHENDGVVREYDREGRVVWTFDVPLFGGEPRPGHGFEAHGDQAFCAVRLAGGDTLIATGNGHGLLRVTPEGEVAQRVTQDGIEDVRLAWTTTVQVLSSGRVVLGNCHAGPDQPQAVELDLETLDVHWRFRDFDRFGNGLSNLEVVERTR